MSKNFPNKAKVIRYKSRGRKVFETIILLLGASFLLLIMTLGIMLHRSLLVQSKLTRIVNLIEKYSGDVDAAKKTEEIMSKVERQTSLPNNELPYIAEIKDVSQLFSMKAFESALNGDFCLVYPDNKKIFIYRPSDDALVGQFDFDPENLSKLKSKSTVSPTPTPNAYPQVLVSTSSATLTPKN
ncbi:MAG: hypothetical protein U0525_01415 [Patescibacteria group bacterium]